MVRRSSGSAGPDWGSIIKSRRTARPKHHLPGWPRFRRGPRARHRAPAVRSWAARIGVAVLVLLLFGAALMGYALVRLEKVPIDLEARVPSEPMNVLVLGSDSREGLSKEDQQKLDPTGRDAKSGRRADTIVLVHIDEKQNKAVMVHFPRDLRVTYPSGKTGRINAAYQQGPEAMVRTVEKFTGLPVHHYIEVNFVGFRNMVNALGGVDVYFERAIREPDSGLNVKKGCVELKGDNALAFVRVRKIDDDFGRIARQQLFARLVMDKVVSAGTLLNPYKVVRLVTIGADNVVTDEKLSLGDMKDIALRLRSLDPQRVDMRVVPSDPATIKGASYVLVRERETASLFAALRDRKELPDVGLASSRNVDTTTARPASPAMKPADVTVSVLNGTPTEGRAREQSKILSSRGFNVVEIGDADSQAYRNSIVFYRDGKEEQAQFLAAVYGLDAKPVPAEVDAKAGVVLVVGRTGPTSPAAPNAGAATAAAAPKALVHAC